MAMAHMLRRVVSVTLVVAFYDARGMLPWLAGIPELARVRFSPNIATSRTTRAKLLESARQALPHVKDIVC
ncbi:hypothetical protein GGX14DRAFT_462125 [Mycena pura]|uniref:Uncharacterized protein n=1 Tax=Mycena pura TaxID=153505 RepID=A0AAD6V5A8_9AGAR|nr:hypothetical protein GGX14DRAFT_462125 [Mycena pura]